MKKLFFIFAILGLTFVSCQKETIEPIEPVNQPQNNNNNGTNGTPSDTLDFEFVVKTIVPISEVDSVVLIHGDYMSVELERFTILPSNIPSVTGALQFSANMVEGITNTVPVTSGDQFAIYIYMNTQKLNFRLIHK